MESCIHEVVCKHKAGPDDQECSLGNICKFAPGVSGELSPAKKRTYKKKDKRELPIGPRKVTGARKQSQQKYLDLTTSDKDVRRARQILLLRQTRGSLTDNQSSALDMYKGIKPKKLTEAGREQIIRILRETVEVENGPEASKETS